MTARSRAFFLALGMALAATAILVVFRKAQGIAKTDKAVPPRTSVGEIQRGAYRFIPDLYGKAPHAESRSLLFLRKADGTLKAWYFPISDRTPAAPDGDWFTPGQKCDPFLVDAEREQIQCVVTYAESNQRVHLRWAWDGQSSGPFAPDMKPVPGKEESGNFVFDVQATVITRER